MLGTPAYDPEFAKAISGHPKGSIVTHGDPLATWVSLVEDNLAVPGTDERAWGIYDGGWRIVVTTCP